MRTGEPCVFQAVLEKVDFPEDGEGCFRILAGGRAFYALPGQFRDTAAAAALRPGERVRIGCHVLDGDAFWLHWLTAGTHPVLKPLPDAGILRTGAASAVLGAAMLVTGTAAVILAVLGSLPLRLTAAAGTAAAIGGMVFLVFGYVRTLGRRSSSWKLLRQALENAQAGSAPCPPAPPAAESPAVPARVPDPELERPFAAGPAEDITAEAEILPAGGTPVRCYRFLVSGTAAAWIAAGAEGRNIFTRGSELVFRRRPFFLAAGDMTEVTSGGGGDIGRNRTAPPNLPLTLLVANRTDGGIHSVFTGAQPGMWKRLYRFCAVCFLLTAAAPLLVWLTTPECVTVTAIMEKSVVFTAALTAGLFALIALAAEVQWNGDILCGRVSPMRSAERACLYALQRYRQVTVPALPRRRDILLRMAGMTALLAGAAAVLVRMTV